MPTFIPKGRRAAPPKKTVVEVEALPCPGRPGPHWLINHDDVTLCRGCGATWAELDQHARKPA
jgi:hypothetical protein